jgi:hypothetical protein
LRQNRVTVELGDIQLQVGWRSEFAREP